MDNRGNLRTQGFVEYLCMARERGRSMYRSLDETEVEQALKIGEALKDHLAKAVQASRATALGVPDHVFRCAAMTECLLLAAFIHSGDVRSFLIMAGRAFADVECRQTSGDNLL
jgi:hypothetical protein